MTRVVFAFLLLLPGCLQSKLMRWAHQEVKFTDVTPDTDEVQYGVPQPSNERGVRIYFWLKNLQSWDDGLYFLRVPSAWDEGSSPEIAGAAFEPVAPVDITIERVDAAGRWGQGHQDNFLLDLVADPIRAERDRWQPEFQSGVYGILPQVTKEQGVRRYTYALYGYHGALGAWVKLKELSLGAGTQWPYRKWVAIPVSVLVSPLDFLMYLPIWILSPGMPDPEVF